MAHLPIIGDDVPSPRAPEAARSSPARPAWLRVRAPGGGRYAELKQLLDERRLHTVCSSAACPNVGECWAAGTATFMILGNLCTRACRFCDVKTASADGGSALAVDLDEPARLADAAELMGLKHVVITSVARDDLEDGGARHFVRCLEAVRARVPAASLEVLVPDFKGRTTSIALVVTEGRPAIFNHNVETSERLTAKIRSGAQYRRSLEVLAHAKQLGARTKTGMMLGLGETDDEVRATMRDARAAGVDIFTLGQYLRPSSWNAAVERYVTPEQFALFADEARALGFDHVEAGPLVRSSYHAERATLPGDRPPGHNHSSAGHR